MQWGARWAFAPLAFASAAFGVIGHVEPAPPTGPLATVTLPIRFEENAGQWASDVRFVARHHGVTLSVTDDAAVIGLRENANLRMRLARGERRDDARGTARGERELVTKSHFFLGDDSTKWRTNVANYERVRVQRWGPGVDVVWYGTPEGLEYDLEVEAGLDASQLELAIEGASHLDVTEAGDLAIATPAGELVQRAPRVLQAGVELHARYVLSGTNRVRFDLEGYDARLAVLIDPVLVYGTYFGGSSHDGSDGIGQPTGGIVVDASGNAIVAGTTGSAGLGTAGTAQSARAGTEADVFVAKLDATGTALVYATYLGGTGAEVAGGLALDASGALYVTGTTYSTDFPTAGAVQTNLGGTRDAFVTKLNANGTAIVYSTYLGGGSIDTGRSIAVDASGNAYVTGMTASSDFPLAGPIQSARSGATDAFVSKLNASGSALVYATLLGGSSNEEGRGIAVDGGGNAYVTGTTSSTDFPTASPLQATYGGGASDAFACKVNAAGSALIYATFVGGSGDEEGNALRVDAAGSAFLAGATTSTNFPTKSPMQATHGSAATCVVPPCFLRNAFVSKLSSAGSSFVYSTYLGGSGPSDGANAIAVDGAGNAYVTGTTDSTNFPLTSPLRATPAGNGDAFVTKLDASGAARVYSTYLGGGGNDVGAGIAVDAAGHAYVAGHTVSVDFPTEKPLQAMHGGGTFDAFIVSIDGTVVPAAAGVACSASSECASGFCVDGVCCKTSCSESCGACNVAGKVGTCTPITGPSHGGRVPCVGFVLKGACAGKCDGTSLACTYPDATKDCGSTCKEGVESPRKCDGAGGCASAPSRTCKDLTCSVDGVTCKGSCATSADCAEGESCVDTTCTPQAVGGGSNDGASNGSTPAASSESTDGGCGVAMRGAPERRLPPSWPTTIITAAAIMAAVARRRSSR